MDPCYGLGTMVFYIHYLMVILLKTLQSTHYSQLIEEEAESQIG